MAHLRANASLSVATYFRLARLDFLLDFRQDALLSASLGTKQHPVPLGRHLCSLQKVGLGVVPAGLGQCFKSWKVVCFGCPRVTFLAYPLRFVKGAALEARCGMKQQ